MSGAMHVCGVPTVDRLVRKGRLDKAILEHRPKWPEGESCDSVECVPGLGTGSTRAPKHAWQAPQVQAGQGG